MVAKQASIHFPAIDEKMPHVQLSCQVQCVALQSGVFDDVQLREIWLTRRVESRTTSEATVDSEDTSTEHMSAEKQSEKIVSHEEEERGI